MDKEALSNEIVAAFGLLEDSVSVAHPLNEPEPHVDVICGNDGKDCLFITLGVSAKAKRADKKAPWSKRSEFYIKCTRKLDEEGLMILVNVMRAVGSVLMEQGAFEYYYVFLDGMQDFTDKFGYYGFTLKKSDKMLLNDTVRVYEAIPLCLEELEEIEKRDGSAYFDMRYSRQLLSIITNKYFNVPRKDRYARSSFSVKDGVFEEYSGPGGDILIPDGFTEIRSFAFERCKNLRSVTIPDSVMSIGTCLFSGVGRPQKIVVSEGNPAFCTDDRGVLFNKAKTLLLQAPGSLSGGYTVPVGVKRIGDGAFLGCKELTGIALPDSVTEIGEHAFEGCRGLTGIALPSGVTQIGNSAFAGCTGLTGIVLPNGVTQIWDSMFAGCRKLQSVTIPYGVTQIKGHAFADCVRLKSVTLPKSLTSIGSHAFEGCCRLTEVTLPQGMASIGDHAFYKCTGLTSIMIPNTVKSIRYGAFCFCAGLTNITIPDSVTEIGDYMFINCRGLRVRTPAGSAAERYCKENGIPCDVLPPKK